MQQHDISQLNSARAELGQHLILELYEAKGLFNHIPALPILEQAARATGAVLLGQNFHDFGERSGFTGIITLAESHISIHTWPEYNYAAIDIFLCGGLDPYKAVPSLKAYFEPGHIEMQMIKRGISAHKPAQPVQLSAGQLSAGQSAS